MPVEWNASNRFPEFEVTCSATQGMLGENLLCFKMADFLNIFAALEQDDCETIICTILDSNDDVILLAAVACFMRRELTGVNGYFEVTTPAYLSGEFENHFRITKETCQLLTQEIMHTGWIPTVSSCVHDHVQDDMRTLFGSHVTRYIIIAQSLRITINRKRRIL